MRLIQYKSVLTFKLQIEFVPFKIVPLGGYTPFGDVVPTLCSSKLRSSISVTHTHKNCFTRNRTKISALTLAS